MGFYEDTRAAAVAVKEAKETQRKTRATAKQMRDAVEAAITTIRTEGEFKCALMGAEALANTSSARVGTSRLDGLLVLEVAPELVVAIADSLKKRGFHLLRKTDDVPIVSWEPETAYVEATPSPI